MSTDTLLTIAIGAAREAGELLAEYFRAPARGVRAKTSVRDLVSEADLAAERLLRERLQAARPQDGVIGEEYGERGGSSGLTWAIDPLDGSANFLHGIPHWNVSIGCRDRHGSLVGAIFDPLRGEMFAAGRGLGATLNGRSLTGSSCTSLEHAIVHIGLSIGGSTRAPCIAALVPQVLDQRYFGSLALDLAWTAAGRFDACYYEYPAAPWDTAAADVICREAGLQVMHIAGEGASSASLLAAPPILVEPLLMTLAN